jgi:hypothetical protein
MRLAEYDRMIKALSPDRPNDSFDVSILPRRPRRHWMIADSHGVKSSLEHEAITGVTVTDKMSRGLIPRERLTDLPRNPLCGRVCGRVRPHKFSTLQIEDGDTIQKLETNCWDNE